MNAAVMGYGTIGSGVVEIIEKNQDIIASRINQPLEVKYVLDLRDFPGTQIEKKITHDFQDIVSDESVGVVVETMGGLKPSYSFVKACLEAGKHVVTSNKALVAAHGTELLAIAREKHVNFLFEASVGGGIPIIRSMYRSLQGEKIQEITGILNGTTNYILTMMDHRGETFEQALKEAQELGYAERNPEADVEGYDTCRKIAILTAMATGKEVDYEEISTEGITKITDIDFKYADQMGTSVKLFGSSQITEDKVHVWVAPVMIDANHPLYAVNDVFNGILVKGNMLGTSMFYGSGAGKLPTASAVVADMIEAVQFAEENIPLGWNSEKLILSNPMECQSRFFVRISGKTDEKIAEAKTAFQAVKTVLLDGMNEFAVVTAKMSKKEFETAAGKLGCRVIQVMKADLENNKNASGGCYADC